MSDLVFKSPRLLPAAYMDEEIRCNLKNSSISQLIATHRDLHSSSDGFPTRLGGHTSSAANDSPCGVHYRENISYLGHLARRRFLSIAVVNGLPIYLSDKVIFNFCDVHF